MTWGAIIMGTVRVAGAMAFAWMIAASPLQAAPAGAPASVITVVGHGQASRPPDFAWLKVSLRGEGKTQVDALRSLAAARAKVETSLPDLEGLSSLTLETGELAMGEVRADDCPTTEPYNEKPRLSAGACAVIGYVVTLDINAQVRPASRLGDAASLASQQGAVDVSVEATGVDEPTALVDEATAAAVRDALRQAGLIAAGAGGRVGRIVRIVDRNASLDFPVAPALAAMAPPPMAKRKDLRPEVGLDLTVEPLKVSADYIVDVELLR